MRAVFLPIATIGCSLISGCAFGPQTKTEYVLIRPGVPVRVLENVAVKCKTLASEKVQGAPISQPVQQDVGGWVAMPEEHWDVIEKKLKEAKIVEEK